MEFWINVADIVASLATVGALIAVVYEIAKSREIEKRQASFEIMANFQEIAEDRRIFRALTWEDAKDFEKKYPTNSSEATAFGRVTYFWETLGEATFHQLLDRQMVFLQMGTGAIYYWEKIEPLVDELRASGEMDETDYLYFEWFYYQAMKAFPEAGRRLISETDKLRNERDNLSH